ncbi:MAG: 2-succinyl-5-enolpyruvyl-6-hydroxy-3-cyclohexene-1-carboxylic-acid synthase, partial [bacterium]|nr:2-succinyl-5-enolpyruvyl-6-hydroxy-3-cyclohexene-1-carboxylic-acid synthase [bacterium]
MTAYEYFGAFFEELANRGVRHAVCSPGSRSAPLVLSAHAEPRLRCWVQLDERAGGFFALGLAKAERRCVALICTSGSAAANYLPAVTEAFYDGVGLVVLTADRPPELRDRGAGQTIDQIGLYGAHVRWSADLPIPGEVGPDHARFTAHRAVTAALGPPGGPVHLNVPLREPLEPLEGQLGDGAGGGESPGSPRLPAAEAGEVAQLADLVRNRERGVLAVGPSDLSGADAGAVKRLAALAGWPLLADAASGLRTGGAEGAAIVAAGQHLARTGPFWNTHRPDVLVRAGHPTAARALREGLAAWGADVWLVDPLDRWEEPTTVPTGRWRSPLGALARGTLAALGSRRSATAWADSWRLAESTAQQTITATLEGGPLLEAGLARLLGETLEPGTVLYA